MQRRLTEISWEQAWHHNSLELIGMTPTFAIWMAIIVLAIVIAITGIVMYRYGIQM